MDPITLRFYSLNGATIDEKRRNFNAFLKSLESSTSDTNELTDFISSIKPTNATEELFRIEILIQFKQYDLIRNELKKNSPLLVGKLLKNWKLFASLFSSIDAQTLANDILPYVSYSLKCKLLSGICKNVKNEILLDEYFLVLEKKYGLKTALILLPGSTMELIKSKISELYIRLTNRQVIAILKKDKQFLDYYFDVVQKRHTYFNLVHNYSQSLKFIAKTDAILYWKLCEKYKCHLRFGKHMTVKMFRTNNKVLNEASKYIYDFQIRKVYKTLSKDGNLKGFLINSYPETIETLTTIHNNTNLMYFTSFISKHTLYSLIMSTCKEKYGKNLLDYPEYWTRELIKLLPVIERESILNVLVKQDEKLVYFYRTSKSIPIIKKRLQHASDATVRSQLIILMYKTCAVNENKEALLEALHFVVNRYKNDVNLVISFFDRVMGWPSVITLDEKYWKYIADMAKIIEIIKGAYYHFDFYVKYICHLLENNMPCQEQCKQYVKHILNHSYGKFDYTVDKKYERRFIEQMGECIAAFQEHKYYQNVSTNFLRYLAEYNNRNAAAQIPYNNYSHFYNQIKTLCSENNQVPIEFGLKTYQTEFWHDLFWSYCGNGNLNHDMFSWYLKIHPMKFVQNINKIVNSLNKTDMERLLKKARRLLDEDASEKINMYALDHLHSKNKNRIKMSLKIISILKPESLSEFILPLLTEPDLETNLKKSENNVLLQVLIKYLHKLGNPLDIFPLIPHFCTRYHFKSALAPLHSVAHQIPQLQLKHYLMQFFHKGPSIRKQILILAKDLLIQDAYVKLLEELCETEQNTSIKNIIFMKTLQYFIENPSDSLWILTQNKFKLLDKEDRYVFNSLLKYDKIPLEYLSQYIEFIFVEISNNIDYQIKEKRFQLLDSIPSQVIGNLNTEFMTHVIVDTACRERNSNFHWKCVFDTHGKRQEQLFQKNFEALQIFVETNRNLNKSTTARSVITNFLYRFLDIAIELKQGANLIDKFIASWTSIFQPNSFCKEYTTLLFTDLYFKSNFDAALTGNRINQLLCNYIDTYGSSIIHVFSRHLKQFLDKIDIKKQEEIMKFIEGFIDNKYDEHIYLIVIHILAEISEMDYYRNNSNIKKIQECSNPVVKFHYDVYIA